MALLDILFAPSDAVNFDLPVGDVPDPELPGGISLQALITIIDERVKRIDGNTQPL